MPALLGRRCTKAAVSRRPDRKGVVPFDFHQWALLNSIYSRPGADLGSIITAPSGHPSVTERPVALPPIAKQGERSWVAKNYHPNRSGTSRPKPSSAKPRSCLTAESAKNYCARRASWRRHPISTSGYRRRGLSRPGKVRTDVADYRAYTIGPAKPRFNPTVSFFARRRWSR